MQWNMTGVTVAGTGVAGSSGNQFSSPWNLFVDSNKNIYVADANNHRIQYWSAGAITGVTIAGTGSSGSALNQLNIPSDIFVTSAKNFYVADRGNNRIMFFRNGSTTGSSISTGWGGTGGFRGVQVDSAGRVYGNDTSNHALWRNNTVPLGYQGAGSGSHQLNGNQGIAIDNDVNVGYVYIANANQHTVVQWIPVSSTANVVAGTNGVLGNSNTTMAYPVAVRLDSSGNLYVVDNNNHRVQLYCRSPNISTVARTIIGTGSAGATAMTLNFPSGLALDSDLNIYVADTSNHRVQKFMRIT